MYQTVYCSYWLSRSNRDNNFLDYHSHRLFLFSNPHESQITVIMTLSMDQSRTTLPKCLEYHYETLYGWCQYSQLPALSPNLPAASDNTCSIELLCHDNSIQNSK